MNQQDAIFPLFRDSGTSGPLLLHSIPEQIFFLGRRESDLCFRMLVIGFLIGSF